MRCLRGPLGARHTGDEGVVKVAYGGIGPQAGAEHYEQYQIRAAVGGHVTLRVASLGMTSAVAQCTRSPP